MLHLYIFLLQWVVESLASILKYMQIQKTSVVAPTHHRTSIINHRKTTIFQDLQSKPVASSHFCKHHTLRVSFQSAYNLRPLRASPNVHFHVHTDSPETTSYQKNAWGLSSMQHNRQLPQLSNNFNQANEPSGLSKSLPGAVHRVSCVYKLK